MNNGEIVQKIKKCRKGRTQADTIEAYDFLLKLLLGIRASGEVKNESTVTILDNTISDFYEHKDLAIVSYGRVSKIDCNIAARHNITIKSNACSGMFPVMKVHDADLFLELGQLPPRGFGDLCHDSIITKRLFYRRYPEQLVVLTQDEIKALEL